MSEASEALDHAAFKQLVWALAPGEPEDYENIVDGVQAAIVTYASQKDAGMKGTVVKPKEIAGVVNVLGALRVRPHRRHRQRQRRGRIAPR